MKITTRLINSQLELHLDPETDDEAMTVWVFARPHDRLTAELAGNEKKVYRHLIIRKERT